jgi:hypothetical protein
VISRDAPSPAGVQFFMKIPLGTMPSRRTGRAALDWSAVNAAFIRPAAAAPAWRPRPRRKVRRGGDFLVMNISQLSLFRI